MKRLGISIVVVMGLCLAAGFGAAAALAATNTYISQFNDSETKANPFEPDALAVNSKGDVYVADLVNGVVDEFNSSGTGKPLAEFNGGGTEHKSFQPRSLAVNSNGDVYVGDYVDDVVDEFSPPATGKSEPIPLAEFTGGKTTAGSFKPFSLAVNSSEDVYVGDTEGEVVDEFSPPATGKSEPIPLAEFNGRKTKATSFSPRSLAVNSSKDVYVGDHVNDVVDEFSPPATGKSEPIPLAEITAPQGELSPNTIAVTKTGVLYVGYESGSVLNRFSASGHYECEITGTSSSTQCGGSASETPQGSIEPTGVAVSPKGDLYQSDIVIGDVNIFSPGVTVIEHPLTVKKSGTGNSTVTSTPAGIECKSAEIECTEEFPEENVKLKATAAPGSTFTKWEGCTAVSGGECEVTMSAAKEVKAESTANTLVAFTPTDAGIGTGEVKCEIDKDGGFVTCASEYGKGTELVIEGVEAAGATFAGWSNGTGSAEACTGTGTCAFTIEAATTITATFNKAINFPLNVYVTGKGEVSSNPAGILACTATGGTCEAQLKGVVTLTATAEPGSGYVLAGWIGCKKATASTCEVNVTQAREVTVVFLQEGVQGKNGEGAIIEVLAPGEHGCAAGGIAVKVGAAGTPTYLCNGKEGEVGVEGIEGLPGPEGKAGALGERGAAGASGATGSAGAQGPRGSAGPTGKEGPAGKVELVTCKKVGNKQKCTTKLVSGTFSFTATGSSAHATLSRHGAVYAAGTARGVHGRMSLRLLTVRRLRPGRYTLTLISGSGRHERIRNEAFTLR
jgi:Collagen triple helix repeat (20 copies)/Divergent InlB B-repeat domain